MIIRYNLKLLRSRIRFGGFSNLLIFNSIHLSFYNPTPVALLFITCSATAARFELIFKNFFGGGGGNGILVFQYRRKMGSKYLLYM